MEKAGILVWLSSQTYKFDRSTNSTYSGFQLSRLSSYIVSFINLTPYKALINGIYIRIAHKQLYGPLNR